MPWDATNIGMYYFDLWKWSYEEDFGQTYETEQFSRGHSVSSGMRNLFDSQLRRRIIFLICSGSLDQSAHSMTVILWKDQWLCYCTIVCCLLLEDWGQDVNSTTEMESLHGIAFEGSNATPILVACLKVFFHYQHRKLARAEQFRTWCLEKIAKD